MKINWPDFSQPLPAAARRMFRRNVRALSLNDQLAVWQSIKATHRHMQGECEIEITSIRSELKRIARQVPSDAWDEDTRKIPVVHAPGSPLAGLDAGGAWPPGGKDTLMRRAKGEWRLYPPQYLTASGHSWDVWVQHVYAGTVQHLVDIDDDDGYRGGLLTIYDLHPSERARVRRAGGGHKRSQTNRLHEAAE